MKNIFIAILFLVALTACTKNFQTENQNPYQISDEMLKQDFNLVGSPFSQLLFNLNGHQIEEDLCQDSWMGYLNTWKQNTFILMKLAQEKRSFGITPLSPPTNYTTHKGFRAL